MIRRRRWLFALPVALALAALAGFEWLSSTRTFGDSGAPFLERCDVRAFLENRPQTDRPGCFVRIPGGTLRMGAQATDPAAPGFDPDATPDEAPVRTVDVAPFLLQREEVTRGQYDACLAAGACPPDPLEFVPADERLDRSLPVRAVTFDEADAYCRFAGARLPSEPEWEYAARGPDARRYPWGIATPDCEHARFDPGDAPGCGLGHPTRANDRPRWGESPFLVLHLAGNVWEWTADEDRSGTPGAAERRVQKGGGYTDTAESLRGSARGVLERDVRQDDVGVRCAADPAPFEVGWLFPPGLEATRGTAR